MPMIARPSGAASWDDLADKPSTFAPSSHTHVVADLDSEAATVGQVPAADGAGAADWNDQTGGSSVVQSPQDPARVSSRSGFTPPEANIVTPSVTFTVPGGTAIIEGVEYTYASQEFDVTGLDGDRVIYADADDPTELKIATLASQALPPTNVLHLCDAYINVGAYGAGVYGFRDRRTFGNDGKAGYFPFDEFLEYSVIPGGAYQGGVRMAPNGDLNFYFANLGLLAFVASHPDIVEDHLALQCALFYATATGTGETNYVALHGGSWAADYVHWPYDVNKHASNDAPFDFYDGGTPVLKRADSHDSYVGTFLTLAVKYARSGSAGMSWWNANIAAIQNAMYYGYLLRLDTIPAADPAAYGVTTFYNRATYDIFQTMDQIEAYHGASLAYALMVENGGAQATWCTTNSVAAALTNHATYFGYVWAWSGNTGLTENTAGETDWLSKCALTAGRRCARSTSSPTSTPTCTGTSCS